MEDCEKKVKEASWGVTYKQIGDLTSSAGAAVRDGSATRAAINAAASISEFGKSIVSRVTNAGGSGIGRAGEFVSNTGTRYIEITKECAKIIEDCRAIRKKIHEMDGDMYKLVEKIEHIAFESSIVVNDEDDFDATEKAFEILQKEIVEARESVYPSERHSKSSYFCFGRYCLIYVALGLLMALLSGVYYWLFS